MDAEAARREARWEIIQRKMAKHATSLGRHGALVARTARGRRVWSVRFRELDGGRQVQRAIYVAGDEQPELLRRARMLLRQYREQAHAARELRTVVNALPRSSALLELLEFGVPGSILVNASSLEPARHSADYRSVHWFGKDYTFTANQAAAVKVLWQAWKDSTPDIGGATLLEEVNCRSQRIDDLFKVKRGEKAGHIPPSER